MLPQSGLCKTVGFDEEIETQLRVIFRPMLFFLNLTYKSNRVWFYKTVNSHSILSVPAFGVFAQYVIHFPEISWDLGKYILTMYNQQRWMLYKNTFRILWMCWDIVWCTFFLICICFKSKVKGCVWEIRFCPCKNHFLLK